MSLNKKQKLILNLLLLQGVDEEETIINRVVFNKYNKAHEMFLTRKTEGVYSILIEKHLWRDESKFREFFRLSRDQYTYVLNIIENDITTNTKTITKNMKKCIICTKQYV